MVNTITPFRSRFNNYKSGTTKLSKVYPEKFNVYQKQFHRHFNSEEHNGMKDWKITIIDRAEKCYDVKRVIGNTGLIRLSLLGWMNVLLASLCYNLFYVSRRSLYSISNVFDAGLDTSYYIGFQAFFCIIWTLTAIIWTRFLDYP